MFGLAGPARYWIIVAARDPNAKYQSKMGFQTIAAQTGKCSIKPKEIFHADVLICITRKHP